MFAIATFRWTSLIDSRERCPPDIGRLPNAPSGDFCETGEAPHPETNIVTMFEERWRRLSIPFIIKFPYAWILQSDDGQTFVGQTGAVFLAMSAGNEDGKGDKVHFCARKELWDNEKGAWEIEYEVGNSDALAQLPKMAANGIDGGLDWESSSSEGDSITAFGAGYVVRALVKAL